MSTPQSKALIVIDAPKQPQNTPSTSGATLGQEILAEAEQATQGVPSPGGAAQAGSIDGLTDRWGRKFDPELHLTNKFGQPAVKHGRVLIVKAGKQPAGNPKPAARPATTGAGHIDSPALEPGPSPAAGAAPQNPEQPQQPTATEAPILTEAQRQASADMDSENWLEALGAWGQWMAGKRGEFLKTDTKDEEQKIRRNTARWFFESGNRLPFGAATMAFLANFRYVIRVMGEPEAEDKYRRVVNRVRQFFGYAAMPPRTYQAPEDPPAPVPSRPSAIPEASKEISNRVSGPHDLLS